MRILSTTTNENNQVIARPEYGCSLTMHIVGKDGYGHYAVHWDDDEKWLAGLFVDEEDGGWLYPAYPNDTTFSCENGAELECVDRQDGGTEWRTRRS